jgi:UDP-glucose 4-epimerase
LEYTVKILVTGGAGFIGSNVVDGYLRAGHEVLVVDNLYTGRRSNVNPQARFYELDIRSPEVRRVMELERPDVLNHHAAQMSVPDSVSDPIFDADINIKGFLNLLEAAVRFKTKKVIFVSSGGAIYGEPSEYPTSEDCEPRPLSPYAITKYCSEHYLVFYRHQYGLEYTTLRYSNIYGPRQVRHGEAGVAAIFMDNLLKGVDSTLNHFPDDEEGMIRDYCYVGDVVKANLYALGRGDGDFFNIGTGQGTKTVALYDMIFEAFKRARPGVSDKLAAPVKRLARPGDLTKSCLVVKKASAGLGWTPETGLKEGIHKTLDWRLNQPV